MTPRKRIIVAIALIAWILAGCDDGAQHGKFAVSTSSAVGTNSPNGAFTVFRGGPPHAMTARESAIPLLCVLVVTPRTIASGSGGSYPDGKYISNYEWNWTTPGGKIEMKLTWDRRTDEISAGGKTFDRSTGNAIILMQDASGAIVALQVKTAITAADDVAAFGEFKAALPLGSPVSGVTLAR